MTTIVAVFAALILTGVALRMLRAALPLLAVVILVGLAVTRTGGAVDALAGPLLLLLIMAAGFGVMLRGFFR